MPVKTPRIMFTPAPETYELLKTISDTTGQPLSAVCRDCMETLTDHLRMLSKVLVKVGALQDGARQAAADAAAVAERELGPVLAEAARVMLKMSMAMDEPGLPLDADQPPASNTGATSLTAGRREAA